MRVPRSAAAGAILLIACGGGVEEVPASTAGGSHSEIAQTGEIASPGEIAQKVDVGGYSVWIMCEGIGEPTVVLEAGYTAAGTDTWRDVQGLLREDNRTCLYDRAEIGLSDPRPEGTHLTTSLQARELHAALAGAGVGPPYVLVGHSYGGMIVRLFAAAHPEEVAGMILEDSSQEDEIDAYREVHAGAWIDGPAQGPESRTRQRIDIQATEQDLRDAGDLGDLPLIVLTAEFYEDVLDPTLEAEVQLRLAGLSTEAFHVLALDSGHFIHIEHPSVLLAAVRAVVAAARDDGELPPCEEIFREAGGRCLRA